MSKNVKKKGKKKMKKTDTKPEIPVTIQEITPGGVIHEEKIGYAIEADLLNDMIRIISDLPYRVSHEIMKKIEKTAFHQVNIPAISPPIQGGNGKEKV